MKQTKLFLTRTAAMLFAVLLSHAAWAGGFIPSGSFSAVDYNSEYTTYSLNSGAFKVYLYTDSCAYEGLNADGNEIWSGFEQVLEYDEDAYEGEKLFSMEYRDEKGVKYVPKEVNVFWDDSDDPQPASSVFSLIFLTDATELFDITFGTNQEHVVPVENYLDENGNFQENVPSVTISIKEEYKGKSVKYTYTDSGEEKYIYFNLSGDPITKHYVIAPKVFTVAIKGYNGTFTYNGSVHSVAGFDASWDDTKFPGFKKEYITYNGSAEPPVVQSKEEGKSMMKLKPSKFGSNHEGYKPNFVIEQDGWLQTNYFEAILKEDADNSELINDLCNPFKYGGIANVTLNRTFAKDNTWYTICLPFDVTIAGSPLAGADVREMSEASLDEGKMKLNFSETSLTEMEAGKAYLIKWAEGDDLVNPYFKEAKFNELEEDEELIVENPFELGDGKSITFKGTYAPVSYDEADDNSVLLVGDNNTIYYPTKGASLGAFRAFFQLDGLTAYEPAAVEEEAASEAPVFVLSFGATNVKNAIMEAVSGEYYDLSGRRVAQPTKGIYIVNGKKVVVK